MLRDSGGCGRPGILCRNPTIRSLDYRRLTFACGMPIPGGGSWQGPLSADDPMESTDELGTFFSSVMS